MSRNSGQLQALVGALMLAAVTITQPAVAKPPSEEAQSPSTWVGLGEKTHGAAFAFAEDYKAFMNVARTELLTVTEVVRLAEAAGFKPWQPGNPLESGARYYDNNRGRAVALFVIGEDLVAGGIRISASHIDSPRIELKGRPLYEREGFALFQTNIHGGLLNYQWGNIPLALVGRVDRKDGTTVNISVGLKPDDPVLVIASLAPHVDADLRERKNRDVLQAEELDPIVASVEKSADEGVRDAVVAHLKSAYGIGLDDLVSAELSLVPAFAPRDVGFDRALMGIYGQDDRLSAYASLRAVLDTKRLKRTALVFLADNEEVGNRNNTGATSDYLVDLIGELVYAELGESYHAPHLTRALRATQAVSTDVNDGVNPQWPQAWEGGNAPRVGRGVNIKIYGQGNNANSEYTAWVRKVLDDAGVPWQTATYKVGRASGGTLGYELSRRNMEVIDFGAPVLSIHSTWDVSSKIDLWWLYQANKAFFTAR